MINDPDRRIEAIYQELARWGDVPEFREVLREIDPRELVTLLRSVKRLGLIGDMETVQERIDAFVAVVEAHERWQQRFQDAAIMWKIFLAVGAGVAAVWAWGRDLLTWLVR